MRANEYGTSSHAETISGARYFQPIQVDTIAHSSDPYRYRLSPAEKAEVDRMNALRGLQHLVDERNARHAEVVAPVRSAMRRARSA